MHDLYLSYQSDTTEFHMERDALEDWCRKESVKYEIITEKRKPPKSYILTNCDATGMSEMPVASVFDCRRPTGTGQKKEPAKRTTPDQTC